MAHLLLSGIAGRPCPAAASAPDGGADVQAAITSPLPTPPGVAAQERADDLIEAELQEMMAEARVQNS